MKMFGQFFLLRGARRAQNRRLPFVVTGLVLFFAGTLLLSEARSATIYTENFDDGSAATRWTTATSGPTTSADFAYDYTATLDFAGNPIGVPQTGQTSHTGLKLAANTAA